MAHWSRVVNWNHYNWSNYQLNQHVRSLIVALWNEKDWRKKQHPEFHTEIEKYINESKYIKVVADLANSIKHGGLDRKPRSDVKQTDYFGRIEITGKNSRELYYLEINGEVVELFQVLRGALNEYDVMGYRLSNGQL